MSAALPFLEELEARIAPANFFLSPNENFFTDANGNTIKTFTLEGTGNGQVVLPAELFAAGSYYYNLVVGGLQVDSKQMILVK